LRRIPDVSFQEVEGHKIFFFFQDSWRKLDLCLASELCEIVGDELFLQVGKTQDLPSKI
jgi:hypothetical protein